jgi:hypothetical protein
VVKKFAERKRYPSRIVLALVAEALEDISSQFEWEGFSERAEKSQQEIPGLTTQAKDDGPTTQSNEARVYDKDASPEGEGTQTEEADESPDGFGSDDDDEAGPSVFEREGIEVAIDLFVTKLIGEKIISEPESLESIFGELFGEDHEITEAACAFDEHVKGYFGAIAYGDMDIAFQNLVRIRDILAKEITHAKA